MDVPLVSASTSHISMAFSGSYYGLARRQFQHTVKRCGMFPLRLLAPSHSAPGVRNVESDAEEDPRADYEIYYNQLLAKKRGSPVWVPGPGMQLPIAYRRRGVSIGDVGLIYCSGGFDFLFNIFLPADHSIHCGGVPEGFYPLNFAEIQNDIEKTIIYGPNSYLASSTLRKTSGVNSE